MTGPVGSRVKQQHQRRRVGVLGHLLNGEGQAEDARPEPPYSTGMHKPSRPASRNASKRSVGYAPSLSMARARGLTLSWARRRTESRSSSSSSGVRNPPAKATGPSRPGIFWSLTPDEPATPSSGPPDVRATEHARVARRPPGRAAQDAQEGAQTPAPLAAPFLYAAAPSWSCWPPWAPVASTSTPTTASTRSRRSTPSTWCAAARRPGKPFNLLLVGSDSRAFVTTPPRSRPSATRPMPGGQRSDVTMVARFDPAAKTVTVLSIPRDLWVDIPGNDSGISGMNRINAAYDSGPDLLDPDHRAGPRHPHQPLHGGGLPGLLGHGQRPGRHHHGLPDRGQGPLHRPRRDHHGLPGGQRDHGPQLVAAGTSTT